MILFCQYVLAGECLRETRRNRYPLIAEIPRKSRLDHAAKESRREDFFTLGTMARDQLDGVAGRLVRRRDVESSLDHNPRISILSPQNLQIRIDNGSIPAYKYRQLSATFSRALRAFCGECPINIGSTRVHFGQASRTCFVSLLVSHSVLRMVPAPGAGFMPTLLRPQAVHFRSSWLPAFVTAENVTCLAALCGWVPQSVSLPGVWQ